MTPLSLHRSDNDAPLGIVSSSYEIVQPNEAFDFFRDLIHSIGLEINTAGTLFGGKRYFVSAKIGEQALIQNDNIRGYLLFTTSADGTLKLAPNLSRNGLFVTTRYRSH